MARQTRLLAFLCAVVCSPYAVWGASEASLGPSNGRPEQPLAGREEAAFAEKETAGLQKQEQTTNTEAQVPLDGTPPDNEETQEENEAQSLDVSPDSAAGLRLRRLKASRRHGAASGGRGRFDWGQLLV